jgi:hypothetical protein
MRPTVRECRRHSRALIRTSWPDEPVVLHPHGAVVVGTLDPSLHQNRPSGRRISGRMAIATDDLCWEASTVCPVYMCGPRSKLLWTRQDIHLHFGSIANESCFLVGMIPDFLSFAEQTFV